MVTNRIQQITAANESLLAFLPFWEEYRHQPDTANFAFGNPQEMVVDGFASTLARAAANSGSSVRARASALVRVNGGGADGGDDCRDDCRDG